MKILITHFSQTGNTQQIAEAIHQELSESHEVDLRIVEEVKADALEGYDLTGAEKLALLTGDVEWIEKQIGPLSKQQRKWLEQPLGAEVLRTFGW